MALAETYAETWEQHDGKIVSINGHNHRIRVSIHRAIYPYPHRSISVHAEACNKSAKWYREQRAILGDDFSTDILGSDIELQADILGQLAD